MNALFIDLNADLGESFGRWTLGDDDALLGVVSSANIACGFHAGDPTTLLRTVRSAAEQGVVIGAQVSYRDLAGFGRRFIDMEYDDLLADVLYQIGALDGLCRAAGTAVAYVKPHGALYNTVVSHAVQASAVVAAVRAYDFRLPILGLPDSEFLRQAAVAEIPIIREAFADRAYTPTGELISRREVGAVLTDPTEVAARVSRLVTTGELVAVDGTVLSIEAESVCLHGDSPGAVQMARAVRRRLESDGVRIQRFVR